MQSSACKARPTLNESPDTEITPSAPQPVTPPPPALLERLVAIHVGREARLGSDDPKHWTQRCSIQRACAPFKVLARCDDNLSVLDPIPSVLIGREGQVVALRGALALGPLSTTAVACEPKPHDPRLPCCNGVGGPAVIQDSDTAVLLDGLGCSGDESRQCCDTPAFGQPVVAAGKLVRIRAEPAAIVWQLEEPRLCSESP